MCVIHPPVRTESDSIADYSILYLAFVKACENGCPSGCGVSVAGNDCSLNAAVMDAASTFLGAFKDGVGIPDTGVRRRGLLAHRSGAVIEPEGNNVESAKHMEGGRVDSDKHVTGIESVKVGPNVERNRANRAAQKERRNKRKELGQDWRKRDGGDMIKQDDSPGTFWNSTSNSVRQRLIDSKAEMHIAENERRTQEARDKIAYMKSPEATMRKAIGMIEFAEKQAKKENDSKVYGWAKTVATSSAESLARSTPDSVPSFDELSAKLAASSQSSFELELKAKQDEIDECKKELSKAIIEKEQESKRVFELELVKEQQVSKAKHDAVVNRMRQLEMEKNKGGSARTAHLDPNLAPSMKSSDQAYARKSYIKQFGFYPYDSK